MVLRTRKKGKEGKREGGREGGNREVLDRERGGRIKNCTYTTPLITRTKTHTEKIDCIRYTEDNMVDCCSCVVSIDSEGPLLYDKML